MNLSTSVKLKHIIMLPFDLMPYVVTHNSLQLLDHVDELWLSQTHLPQGATARNEGPSQWTTLSRGCYSKLHFSVKSMKLVGSFMSRVWNQFCICKKNMAAILNCKMATILLYHFQSAVHPKSLCYLM